MHVCERARVRACMLVRAPVCMHACQFHSYKNMLLLIYAFPYTTHIALVMRHLQQKGNTFEAPFCRNIEAIQSVDRFSINQLSEPVCLHGSANLARMHARTLARTHECARVHKRKTD
jgi:hypothetical protein